MESLIRGTRRRLTPAGPPRPVIQSLAIDPESWGSFISRPQLASKPDVHIGFNPVYEYAALPDTERVVKAIRLVMD